MRQIKFRMWNGLSKKYHYDVENVLTCLAQQNVYDKNMPTRGFTLGYNHIGEGSVFEQFTGLKDKKGRELFEGDKYKLPGSDHIYTVVFFDGAFYGKYQNSHHRLSITLGDIEVIGNTHTQDGGQEG